MATLPRIVDFDDPNYDPFIAEDGIFGEIEDLHGRIEELRREYGDVIPSSFMELMGVALPTDDPRFTFLAYDDVATILTDYKSYSNHIFTKTLGLTFGRTLSAMDPPEHHQFRRIFQKAFLPQHIALWSDKIVDPVVNELIGRFRDRGEADLIQEFTKLYPFEIIYRQLGLPEGDGPIFHRLAVAENFVHTPEGREAAHKLGVYFKSLLDERRRNPGDDLASALVNAEDGGEKLPEDVIISFLRQLINAAGDTTFRGTSVLLTGLLTHPDQFAALRNDRSLMPQAIEEGLRWEPPIAYTERTAVRDCVISGVHIPAGATLNPSLAAANIDKRAFENGEKFDIFRKKTKPPVIFAFGPHMCVGQHLAKLEITRALTALMDRLPNLRLDPDKPAPAIQGAMLRHPKHLYVRFE